MKAAESKTTTASQSLQAKGEEQQPFFQQKEERQGAFFGKEPPAAKPFFTPFIQPKLTIGQPGDPYEQEADAMADQVVQRLSEPHTIQPKCAECAEEEKLQKKDEEEEMMEQEESIQRKSIFESNEETPAGQVQRKCENCEAPSLQPLPVQLISGRGKEPSMQAQSGLSGLQTSSDLESRLNATKGAGSPLPEETRSSMGSAFGTDFSKVRVHTNSTAVQMNQELGAQAFTHGSDVYFGAGKYAPGSTEGQRLLGHELTHVVQQSNGGKLVQCYEAGEHAQFGETQANLKTHFAPTSYKVEKGDKLSFIAKKFGIMVAELKAANKAKLKEWPATDGSGRMIEGFNAGETVSIPQKINEMAEAVTKDKSAKFTVNGVVLDYGVGIAMGDFFESPEQMAKAKPKELEEIAMLIKREQTGGKVTTEEWQKATGGRYLELAEKNEAHFAPRNAALVSPSATGGASPNHYKQWTKYHKDALSASQSGEKDKALMINAFGDHFLTDAFAAGHLVNKRDMMEQFKSQLKLVDPKAKEEDKEFTKKTKKFFDAVAKDAFKGDVKTEFSKYETVGYAWNPNFDTVKMFSKLLQGIHKGEPDLLSNAVAKGVHDKLNTFPGGVPVENVMGDKWNLSGDGTLNEDSLKVARKAVAQSQFNVISVFNQTKTLDYPALYQRVWDFTPKPSAIGAKHLVDAVKKGTDVESEDLKKAIVQLIKDNYLLMIGELVKRKKIKKA